MTGASINLLLPVVSFFQQWEFDRSAPSILSTHQFQNALAEFFRKGIFLFAVLAGMMMAQMPALCYGAKFLRYQGMVLWFASLSKKPCVAVGRADLCPPKLQKASCSKAVSQESRTRRGV